jgi:hypothetical protein
MVAQSANHFAQQSASAMANARWHRGAMTGGPGHALDAAQVSSHARLMAQRRWGTGCAATACDAQSHAHATTSASAPALVAAAGAVDWLPWLALGGSLAALIAAEAVRRHVQAGADGHVTPVGGIPLTAFVLYIVAALLAVLALYLFVRRA